MGAAQFEFLFDNRQEEKPAYSAFKIVEIAKVSGRQQHYTRCMPGLGLKSRGIDNCVKFVQVDHQEVIENVFLPRISSR